MCWLVGVVEFKTYTSSKQHFNSVNDVSFIFIVSQVKHCVAEIFGRKILSSTGVVPDNMWLYRDTEFYVSRPKYRATPLRSDTT